MLDCSRSFESKGCEVAEGRHFSQPAYFCRQIDSAVVFEQKETENYGSEQKFLILEQVSTHLR